MGTLLLTGMILLNHVLVPASLCDGIANDGTTYSAFINLHALDEKTAAEMERNPAGREALRRLRAERWSGQVKAGQIALCGQASF